MITCYGMSHIFMSLKMRLSETGLTSQVTFIGILSCVDPLMNLKIQALLEASPILLTFVGFLNGVDSLMVLKT